MCEMHLHLLKITKPWANRQAWHQAFLYVGIVLLK